jgi:hypothetical protein
MTDFLKARANQKKSGQSVAGRSKTKADLPPAPAPKVAPPKAAPVSHGESIASQMRADSKAANVDGAVTYIDCALIDIENQVRSHIRHEHVVELAHEFAASQSKQPNHPITVFPKKNSARVLACDGEHRFLAMKWASENYDLLAGLYSLSDPLCFDSIRATTLSEFSDDLSYMERQKLRYKANDQSEGFTEWERACFITSLVESADGEITDGDIAKQVARSDEKVQSLRPKVNRIRKIIGCGFEDIIAEFQKNSKISGAIKAIDSRLEVQRLESVSLNAEEKANNVSLSAMAEADEAEGVAASLGDEVSRIENELSEADESSESFKELSSDLEKANEDLANAIDNAANVKVAAKQVAEAATKSGENISQVASETLAKKSKSKVAKSESVSIPLELAIKACEVFQCLADTKKLDTVNISDKPTRKEIMSIFNDRLPEIHSEIKG